MLAKASRLFLSFALQQPIELLQEAISMPVYLVFRLLFTRRKAHMADTQQYLCEQER